MSKADAVSTMSEIQAVISSFGYLHGPGPQADVVVDVRVHLRDPHIDPALRELTGHHGVVVARVLDTPGTEALIEALVATATALLPAASRAGRVVSLAVGCAGGRHRSVVIADAIAARLALAGWGAEAEHPHLTKPLIKREVCNG